jgi:hypothetical protein
MDLRKAVFKILNFKVFCFGSLDDQRPVIPAEFGLVPFSIEEGLGNVEQSVICPGTSIQNQWMYVCFLLYIFQIMSFIQNLFCLDVLV